jgi:hypothetical protein
MRRVKAALERRKPRQSRTEGQGRSGKPKKDKTKATAPTAYASTKSDDQEPLKKHASSGNIVLREARGVQAARIP